MNNTQEIQTSSSSRKNIVMLVLLLVIIALALAVSYLLYSNSRVNPESTEEVDTTTQNDYEFTNDNGDQTVDETVDAIETELINLNTELDFEDFDSELELGL